MSPKQKEMQARLEKLKKNQPSFAGKNNAGSDGSMKANKQNARGKQINAPRKAGI